MPCFKLCSSLSLDSFQPFSFSNVCQRTKEKLPFFLTSFLRKLANRVSLETLIKPVGFQVTGTDTYLIDGEEWTGKEMELIIMK